MAALTAPAAHNSVKSSVAMTDSATLEATTLEATTLGRSIFSAQGLLIQLRAHHPSGCLLSELVQVYEGNYIVRALVQVDSTTIATALAAATSVEQAEDQARGRVLEVLGIAPLNLSRVAAITPPMTAPADLPKADLPKTDLSEALPESEPEVVSEQLPAPTSSKATRSKANSRAKSISTEKPAVEPTIEAVEEKTVDRPVLDVPPPPTFEASTFEASIEITGGEEDLEMEYEFTIEDEETPEIAAPQLEETVAPAVPETPVVDLSDVIAQIGAEIDRIGWTKQQGSNYLQQTYNKRTRRELSGDELSSFLKYLKSLPSKVQPVLSELPF